MYPEVNTWNEPIMFMTRLNRITGDSSGVSADIHDRMPVWLHAGQIDDWMAANPDDAMAMLLASEPPVMEAYRVSRAVNTPRNNREDLLQQVA